MNEEKIIFDSGSIALEGLMYRANTDRGMVVTHPHPLYGGDMTNPVVECIQQAGRDSGYTTLRFNFRGVGQSGGHHDGGVGEREDVAAALRCLAATGVAAIDLAGYSFGAWVNAAVSTDDYRRMIMVSPPVAFIDYGPPQPIPGLTLVVTGSEDEIAPATEIRPMLPGWNADAAFDIIDGADHFYWGFLDRLSRILKAHL